MTDIATKLMLEAANDEKKEIAKKALRRNIAIETVADITGLDIETVTKLKSNLTASEKA